MLTTWDDFPVHQTSAPVAHPVSGDPAFYERYYGMLFDRDTNTHAGFGLSLHPNRGIVDAAFSVARDGHQEALFATGPLPADRNRLAVGPFRVDITEPMHSLRVTVDEVEGFGAELNFTAASPAMEENRLLRTSGNRTVSDRTRFVQFGAWSGALTVRGERIACTAWPGVRDRSWGVRHQGTTADANMLPGSIYAIWSVVHFDDCFVQVTVHEDEQGRGHVRSCVEVPKLGPGDPLVADLSTLKRTDSLLCDIDYHAGSRRPASACIDVGPRGGLDLGLRYEPVGTFQMKGLGYYHPAHAQGRDSTDSQVHHESWRIADLDPLSVENVHAQQLSKVHRSDGREGVGIFEHVAIGHHHPSGLPAGLAPPQSPTTGR